MCKHLLEETMNKNASLLKSICSKHILDIITDFSEHLAEKARLFVFNLLMMQYSILKKSNLLIWMHSFAGRGI